MFTKRTSTPNAARVNLNSENVNFQTLSNELKKLQPYKSKLNIEAKNIYMQALNFLIDNDELGDLDV